MASISSNINLVDQVSPVLINITNAVDNTAMAMDNAGQRMDNAFNPNAINASTERIVNMQQQLQRLNQMQAAINAVADNAYVLPNNTTQELKAVNQEIRRIQASINYIKENPFNLDSSFANLQIESLNNGIEAAMKRQNELNAQLGNLPEQIVNIHVKPDISDPIVDTLEPVRIPVQWQTDNNIEVFTTTGIERFQQEIQSANNMLNTLNQTQNQISVTASQTDLFPENAITDINGMQDRLLAIQREMQVIENNPLNFGADIPNAQLEQLRGQLNQAVREQQNLNNAMNNMDIQGANEAYLRLSQTIRGTERYIRDNVQQQTNFNRQTNQSRSAINNNTRQQQRFNAALNTANDSASRLNATIRNMVGAYVGMQGLRQIANGSDSYIQTQARLGLMVDSQQQLVELQNELFASAQRSRSVYADTADAVAKFALNAGHAFDNTAQVIQFTENMNKMFKVSGATAQMQSASMLQLTQALASGTLRGEELNSVLENAPLVARGIEEYMGWAEGSIKNYASDGMLTSEIVRNAVLSMTDDINEKFKSMPKTWSDVWTEMKNAGTYAFQDMYSNMNETLNSEFGSKMIDGLTQSLFAMSTIGSMAFDGLVNGAHFLADNMDIIAPVVIGYFTAIEARAVAAGIKTAVAWTAANLPFALLGLAIGGVILWFNHMGYSATEIFAGICGGVNVVKAYFIGFGETMANQAIAYGNVWGVAIDNFKIGFNNSINSVKGYFWSFSSVVTDIIGDIATKLNKLPFVDIDTSGLYSAADEYAQRALNARSKIQDYKDPIEAYNKGLHTYKGFEEGWISDAFKEGQQWARELIGGISDKFDEYKDLTNQYSEQNLALQAGLSNIPMGNEISIDGLDSLDDIQKSVDSIDKSVGLTATDIKYMLDISARKSIDRYVTPISVTIQNSNTINSELDIDGVVDKTTKATLKKINDEWASSNVR